MKRRPGAVRLVGPLAHSQHLTLEHHSRFCVSTHCPDRPPDLLCVRLLKPLRLSSLPRTSSTQPGSVRGAQPGYDSAAEAAAVSAGTGGASPRSGLAVGLSKNRNPARTYNEAGRENG